MSNSLKARSFNSIELKNGYIKKTGEDLKKLNSEYLWLEEMQRNIYIPAVNKIENGYEIEYINGSNLGEVFWDFGFSEQKHIIDIYFDFMMKNISDFDVKQTHEFLLIEKLVNRKGSVVDCFPNLSTYIANYIADIRDILPEINKFGGVMHGDLFFGNTMFDGISIKLIDPRGYSEENGVFGSVYYDLIKLGHSVIGKYDSVIFGINIGRVKKAEKYFFKKAKYVFGLEKHQILIGVLGLFLSMIPLHSDSLERQKKFAEIAMNIGDKLWRK